MNRARNGNEPSPVTNLNQKIKLPLSWALTVKIGVPLVEPAKTRAVFKLVITGALSLISSMLIVKAFSTDNDLGEPLSWTVITNSYFERVSLSISKIRG